MKSEKTILFEELVYKAVDGVLSQEEQHQLESYLKVPEQFQQYQALIQTYAGLARPTPETQPLRRYRLWCAITATAALIAVCLALPGILVNKSETVPPKPAVVQSTIFDESHDNVLRHPGRRLAHLSIKPKQQRPTQSLKNRIRKLKAKPITL